MHYAVIPRCGVLPLTRISSGDASSPRTTAVITFIPQNDITRSRTYMSTNISRRKVVAGAAWLLRRRSFRAAALPQLPPPFAASETTPTTLSPVLVVKTATPSSFPTMLIRLSSSLLVVVPTTRISAGAGAHVSGEIKVKPGQTVRLLVQPVVSVTASRPRSGGEGWPATAVPPPAPSLQP